MIITESNDLAISQSNFLLSDNDLMKIKKDHVKFAGRFCELIADKTTELGRKISQEEMAKQFDCTQSFVSQMLSGLKLPATKSAILMAEYFHCSLDWMLTGRGDKYRLSSEYDTRLIRIFNLIATARKIADDYGEPVDDKTFNKLCRFCLDNDANLIVSDAELSSHIQAALKLM